MIHRLHFEKAMFIVSAALGLFTLNLLFGLSNGLLSLAESVQEICVSVLPHSTFSSLSAAITCGIPLANGFNKDVFIQTGLIHLIVVSGGHFIVLDHLLDRIRLKNHAIRMIIFGIFALASGLSAPALRAFFSVVFKKIFIKFSSFASPLQINFFSGMVCLYIFPQWYSSLSFHLSWLCALSLSLSFTFFKKPSFLLVNILIFIMLGPMILVFGQLYPLSLFWNLLVGPIVGGILFPIHLLSIVCHPFSILTDWFWEFLIVLCSSFDQPKFYLSTPLTQNSLLWFSLISQIFFFYLIVHFNRRFLRQTRL